MPMPMDNHLSLNYANLGGDPKGEHPDVIDMHTFASAHESDVTSTNENTGASHDPTRDRLDNARDATEKDEENNVKARHGGRSLDSDIAYMDDQL